MVNLSTGKLTMSLTSTDPHSYFGSTEYAKIEVLDLNNNVVYTKSMTGSGTVPSKDILDIKVGYKLRIYHAEPGRLNVDDLKNCEHITKNEHLYYHKSWFSER
ncbi:putative mucin/carbohydrate-binding domain-containing protein [Listeria cornellensis]|uniref:putative mucin/carbohydrate-binding domain-containing protein n=1 Tax=Listeria cornellensis TaxID=1494961 RepID=UPI00098D67C2|nr:putative mucin/carbohydrate-binding domain-containing protein [Listeria cornellensis]